MKGTYINIADIHMTEPYIYSQFIAGKKIKGDILPLVKAGTTHKVEVTMGGVDAK